jgi:hypothetical protein
MLQQALYQPCIGLALMSMVTTQASTYGSLGLQGELTIPYEDLTEEVVIGWVKASMGEETVAAHEAAVRLKSLKPKSLKWLLVCLGNNGKPPPDFGGKLKGKYG